MQSIKIKSYAKLNLTLNITGSENGYHLLDSLVCSIDLYDTILIKKRKDTLVSVTMKGLGSEEIPPEKNNAVLAGEAFVREFSSLGADITVFKQIPMGAGLGGSSADAAGVLNGMAKLYGVKEDEKLKAIADSLGSDTGYMLKGGFARMTGRGEKILPLDGMPLNFLLIFPSSPVATGKCFGLYDSLPDGEREDTSLAVSALANGDLSALGKNCYNALYAPATKLNGEVQTAYEQAKAFSPTGCAMTGSGSCVFALFETPELCAWAQSRYKGKFKTEIVKSIVPKAIKPWYSPFTLTEEEQKLNQE